MREQDDAPASAAPSGATDLAPSGGAPSGTAGPAAKSGAESPTPSGAVGASSPVEPTDGATLPDQRSESPTRPGRLAIGIDVGGTGIKAAIVDVDTGELRTERVRVRTPQPSTPRRCIEAMEGLVRRLTDTLPLDPSAPVGVGIPGVAIDGTILTATNIDKGWLGFPAGDAVAKALQRRVTIINDADAAGLAELQFGAGRGHSGTVLVITLGTGIGTALFRNGHLVPNTELGHVEIRGRDAESRASATARIRRKLSWVKWASDVDEFLHRIDTLLWPDLIIVGGGVSREAEKFLHRIKVRPPLVTAQLRNEAGIVGAAVRAARMAATSAPDLPTTAVQPAQTPVGEALPTTAVQPAQTPAGEARQTPAGEAPPQPG